MSFGSDNGLIHEAVVTGRGLGAGTRFWTALAHDKTLFIHALDVVERKQADAMRIELLPQPQVLEDGRGFWEDYKHKSPFEDEELKQPQVYKLTKVLNFTSDHFIWQQGCVFESEKVWERAREKKGMYGFAHALACMNCLRHPATAEKYPWLKEIRILFPATMVRHRGHSDLWGILSIRFLDLSSCGQPSRWKFESFGPERGSIDQQDYFLTPVE